MPAENLLGDLGAGHIRISRAVFGWERFTGMVLLAELHITLEGVRELSRGLACEVLERTDLDSRLTERLLFVAGLLRDWWNLFQEIREGISEIPLFPPRYPAEGRAALECGQPTLRDSEDPGRRIIECRKSFPGQRTRTEEKGMSNKTIEFFWDVGSPYTFLASTRIEKVAQVGNAQTQWRPFLLGGVFRETGNRPPLEVPAKLNYILDDLKTTVRSLPGWRRTPRSRTSSRKTPPRR